jgi:anti-sigma B factor antagonist
MESDDGGARAQLMVSRDASGCPVVAIAGEIDISNAEVVEHSCMEVVSTSVGPVVFELAELTFMDSSGLAMLLRFAQRADDLVIRRPSSVAQRLIEASGLTRQLRIESC